MKSSQKIFFCRGVWSTISLILVLGTTGCNFYDVEKDEYGRPIIPDEQIRFVQDHLGMDIAKIHFTPAGFHASTTHHIDLLEQGLSDGWWFLFYGGECGLWPQPISDQGIGGDDLLDVYIHNSSYLLNGKTNLDEYSATFIEIKSSPIGKLLFQDQDRKDLLCSVTAAHELTHVAQFGYLYFSENMWDEGTAVWVTQHLYQILNTLPELTNPMMSLFLSFWPRNSLFTQETTFIYDTYAPFVENFLSEFFQDKTIMEEIYRRAHEQCSGYGCLRHGLQDVLLDLGTDFHEMFHRFSEWNYMTCKNDDGLHYEWNQGLCPDVSVALEASYGPLNYPEEPVVVGLDNSIRGSSSHYLEFLTDETETMVFDLSVQEYQYGGSPEWGLSVIRKHQGAPIRYDLDRLELERYTFTDVNNYSLVLEDWRDYEKIIIIIQNLDMRLASRLGYALSLEPA